MIWRINIKSKRKICVVITARPSYSRIKTVLREIIKNPDLELQLVLAASTLLDKYGNVFQEIEKGNFDIAARVYMVIEGENPVTSAKTVGIGLIELATVFDNLKPDVVVTVADRYETMSTALAAVNMNIPLVHIQGGEVSGSIDEKIRHAVTKLADYHFAATKAAEQRIIKMGEERSRVFMTGCPSIDIARDILVKPELDFNPADKYGGVGYDIDMSGGYIIVMQHPVTTEYLEARQQIRETLEAVKQVGIQTFWFWPNVDAGSDMISKGIRSFRETEKPRNIHFFKNFEPNDFLRLLYNSKEIVGNSSVAIRECSFLGIPAVNIGSRQSGRERGKNVIDVDYSCKEIFKAVKKQLKNGHYPGEKIYGDGRSGKRIADLLAKLEMSLKKRIAY
jgi:UDP-hydrolysing UDP-N-acetyl-D-glucosamine 2-epimerase